MTNYNLKITGSIGVSGYFFYHTYIWTSIQIIVVIVLLTKIIHICEKKLIVTI